MNSTKFIYIFCVCGLIGTLGCGQSHLTKNRRAAESTTTGIDAQNTEISRASESANAVPDKQIDGVTSSNKISTDATTTNTTVSDPAIANVPTAGSTTSVLPTPIIKANLVIVSSVVANPTTKEIYLSDVGNCTIQKISAQGELSLFAGPAQPPALCLNVQRLAAITSMVVDPISGSLYTAGESGLTKFAADGKETFLDPGPYNIVVNSKTGIVYFSHISSTIISKVTPDGVVSDFANVGLEGARGLSFDVSNLSIDADGNLYVLEPFKINGILTFKTLRISPLGQVSFVTTADTINQLPKATTSYTIKNSVFYSPGNNPGDINKTRATSTGVIISKIINGVTTTILSPTGT